MNAKSEPVKRFLGRDRVPGVWEERLRPRRATRSTPGGTRRVRTASGRRTPRAERAHLGLQLLAQRALVGFGRPAPRRGGFLRFPQLFLESGQRRRRLSDACGGETPGVTDRGFSRFA